MAKKAKPKAPPQLVPEEPPRTPDTRVLIVRANVLLGNRARGDELGASPREELRALVGDYPSPAQAARWKCYLKSVVDDEIFDDDLERTG